MLGYILGVSTINQDAFFSKFITMFASVHRLTHDLTQDANLKDVTQVQYKILEYIYINEPVTISEISDCQYISMPNTSREIKKLMEKQLVEKHADFTDRRKQYISLSHLGTNIMDEIFKIIKKRFLQHIKEISKEDIMEIDNALNTLQQKLLNRI